MKPIAQMALIFSAVIMGLSSAAADKEMDLLRSAVVFRGSGFAATTGYQKTITTNYYTAVADGDAATFWQPMESKGPHFIEMLWNNPVSVSGVRWSAGEVKTATLMRWTGGRWVQVAALSGGTGCVRFPQVVSDRYRINLNDCTGKPRVYELSLLGPDQYMLPQSIPTGLDSGMVSVSGVKIPTGTYRPGDVVDISFEVTSTTNTVPFGFLLELSDRDALEDLREYGADFCSGRWAARPDEKGRVAVRMELPPWTPDGRNDILLFPLADKSGRRIAIDSNLLGSIDVCRPNMPPMLDPVESVCVGTNAVGQRGFVINGKWHPAFFNQIYGNTTPERLAATAETGLRILYFQNREAFPVSGENLEKRLKWFDRRIRMALRVNPQNYFILSQRTKADSRKWIQSHPDDLMMLENGERNPENLLSYGSELYERQSEEFVRRLLDFVSRQPYADRIIGYHMWSCTKNDGFIGGAAPNRKTRNREEFIAGDYHPGVQKLFREFLREKYKGDLAALRLAWHDDNVTFDNAIVHQTDLVREDIPGNVLRDPVRSRPAIDYLEFFPSVLSRHLLRIARIIKQETKGKALVLAHYGAIKHCMCFSWAEQLQCGNWDFESVLEDPAIDLYIQAQPYDTREAGNAMHVYQPVKSVDLHNRLYLLDHDPRTLGAGLLKHGRHRSQYEGESVFARDYGNQWIENSGAWISDMSLEPWWKFEESRLPWFTMPEVLRPIRQTLSALEKIDTPRRSMTEVAVVLSLNSYRYEDACRANPHYKGLVNDLLLQNGFPFLGAPYDVILTGDLCRPNLPDYKLYVFLNPTYLTDAERKGVDALKRDGKVLTWFYAPGYSTDEGLSLAAAKAVCGINLKIKPDAYEVPELTYEKDSPLAEGLEHQKLSGTTWDEITYISPAEISPIFYADDDDVKPAGRYKDGSVAYGFKDFGNWKSVWCGVPNFTLEDLVNLARFAGVHLYAQAPVVLTADNRLLMVHNGYDGEREILINLPKPARIRDAFTDKEIANGKEFKVKLGIPETRLLRLDYQQE